MAGHRAETLASSVLSLVVDIEKTGSFRKEEYRAREDEGKPKNVCCRGVAWSTRRNRRQHKINAKPSMTKLHFSADAMREYPVAFVPHPETQISRAAQKVMPPYYQRRMRVTFTKCFPLICLVIATYTQ